MKHLIRESNVPWPVRVTEALERQSLITVDQVIRVGKMPASTSWLVTLTGHSDAQWTLWLEGIRTLVPEDLRQLPPDIDPNLLLTEDMHDYEQQQRDDAEDE